MFPSNPYQESMNTAATKIQAVYRGHSTRQGLAWKLPSGRTLGATLRDAWRQTPSDMRQQLSEESSMSSAMDASSESNGSDVETAYSHESQPSPKSQGLKVRLWSLGSGLLSWTYCISLYLKKSVLFVLAFEHVIRYVLIFQH